MSSNLISDTSIKSVMDRFSTVTDLKPLVCRVTKLAKIAQLVEHNLAKVGVAGSSPVFRSNILFKSLLTVYCPGGGIGRHATLRG